MTASLSELREISLLLDGGHVVRLNGVETASLAAYLHEDAAKDELIEFVTNDKDFILIRRGSIVGLLDRATPTVHKSVTGSSKNYVVHHNVLSNDRLEMLIALTLEREADFVATRVGSGRLGYRRSTHLNFDLTVASWFRPLVFDLLVDVCSELGLKQINCVPEQEIECQVTAHGHGDFYRAHVDNGAANVHTRALSYVFYYRSRPDAYYGGDLRLYKTSDFAGYKQPSIDEYEVVRPIDNSIVFFPSGVWHEVLPTYVPSLSFADSRFTVNGWINNIKVDK